MIMVTVLVLTTAGTAAAFEDFSYAPTDADGDLSLAMTGGETVPIQINFTNTYDEDLPVTVLLHVNHSSYDIPEAAFDVNGTVGSQQLATGFDDGTYILDDVTVDDASEHTVNIDVTSNIRLKPGTYDFEIEVRTLSGLAETQEDVDAVNESTTVELNEANVTLETSDDTTADAEVYEYDTIAVDPPSTQDELIGAVGVEVQDDDADVQGTVEIGYDELNGLDPASVQIHHYEDGTWTAVPTDHDPAERVVRADADSFSMYAAFGQEPESDSFSGPSASPSAYPSEDPDAEAGQDQTITVDQSITLDATESTNADSYEWQIDGQTLEGEQVQYQFDEPGTYEARLIASNDAGTTRDSVTITVQQAQDTTDESSDEDQETDDEQTTDEAETTGPETTEPQEPDDTTDEQPAAPNGVIGAVTGSPTTTVAGVVFLALVVTGVLLYRRRDT